MISIIIVSICLIIAVLAASFVLVLFLCGIINGGLGILDYIIITCLIGLHTFGIRMEVLCLKAVIFKYKKKKINKEVIQ